MATNQPTSDEANDPATQTWDLQIKMLLIGDTAVGKTCLMMKYTQNKFNPVFITTVGIDYKFKIIDVDNKKIRLEIWDTAGQERFRAITRSYLRGAQGILLVYDVTDKSTFDHLSAWMEQINKYSDVVAGKILIGNKCDLEDKRVVSKEQGEALAAQYNMQHVECSAKEGLNVTEAFVQLATTVVKKQSSPASQEVQNAVKVDNKKKEKKGGCC